MGTVDRYHLRSRSEDRYGGLVPTGKTHLHKMRRDSELLYKRHDGEVRFIKYQDFYVVFATDRRGTIRTFLPIQPSILRRIEQHLNKKHEETLEKIKSLQDDMARDYETLWATERWSQW